MTRRAALILTGLSQVKLVPAAQGTPPIIVDTDVGSDDLLAIAFLLSRPDVQIEAITVANGLAHVQPGAINVCRLLTLANKSKVSVYIGKPAPMQGDRAFPEAWRRPSDELPGVLLPSPRRKPESESAAEFLARRFMDRTRPVRLLALGPLTNLAEAFERNSARSGLQQLVVMGGALHVPGNLGDGGAFQTNNTTAEWNIFVDPMAASIVFASPTPITLVPLDATSKVPIDVTFLHEFQARARTPLGKFASQVLESDRPHIEGGYFQAWDPLAAVALVQPGVVTTKRLAIEVLQSPPEDGRTVEVQHQSPNAAVALDANAAEFKRRFLSVF